METLDAAHPRDFLAYFAGLSGEFPRRRNLAQLRRSAQVEPRMTECPLGARG